MSITGTIKYQGFELGFYGSTDIPLKAVMLYLILNPNASKSDVEEFFKQGLRGSANHFIEKVNDILPENKNRYKTEEIELYDDDGNKYKYRVSNQFRKGGTRDNLNYFIGYIKTIGYSINVNFNLIDTIDIGKYDHLLGLREYLYYLNEIIIHLAKDLDTCHVLDSLGDKSSKLSKILSAPDYIKFSLDTPIGFYGKYTKNDLEKVATDLISKIEKSSLDKRIKSELKELIDVLIRYCDSDYKFIPLRKIKQIVSEVDKKSHKDIFDGIDGLEDIINNLKFSVKINGMYLDNEKVIILFLNNILAKPCGNEIFYTDELYNEEINGTYAHEMFHMIHFNQSLEISNKDYGNEVIIEGLAKYFEICYSAKYLGGNAIDDELNDLKDNYSVISYPYAGACYINRYNLSNGRIYFGDVLKNSFTNTYTHSGLHLLLQGTKELDKIIQKLK